MATLTPLQAASPLDANDGSRLTFTADTTETLTRALDDTDGDFGTMDDLSWQVDYRVSAAVENDTYDLSIRIVNGATILAAADSGGTFQTVASNITSTTDVLSAVTAFTYVNTAADKTAWDGASVELQQTHTQTKGKDGVSIEVDFTEFTGNYTAGATIVEGTANGTTTSSGTASALVEVLAAATGSTSSSGTASALLEVLASATGTTTLSGTAAALVIVLAAAAGTTTSSGTASGTVIPAGPGGPPTNTVMMMGVGV